MSCSHYEWLAGLKANSWLIEVNEHACNYVSAKEWIEDFGADWSDVPADLLEGMKASNTIYRLQIYPNTPVGFNSWYGPTLDSVIEQAMAAEADDIVDLDCAYPGCSAQQIRFANMEQAERSGWLVGRESYCAMHRGRR